MPTRAILEISRIDSCDQGVFAWLGRLRRFLGAPHFESMHALLAAVDAKDSYTRIHSLNVAAYADVLATRIGLDLSQRHTLQIASLLHDIGKIGVPDQILNKPGRLTDGEFAVMRRHPQIAVDILRPFKAMRVPRRIILHHHERYDGGGYPSGCSGEAIPLGARILAAADAVDTMLSRRSYKKPMAKAAVRAEMVSQAGLQFDPAVVSVTIGWIDDGGLETCQAALN